MRNVYGEGGSEGHASNEETVFMPPLTRALRRRTTSSAPQQPPETCREHHYSQRAHHLMCSEHRKASIDLFKISSDSLRHKHREEASRYIQTPNPNQHEHPTIGNKPEFQRTKAPSSS
ncbi:hypothetical protein F2Q70_00040220 [Brassica cretica]|uniref:Uncharacterized protein n=1 Tax=Brassica cretica TaxID=69181 RepID=A0A8S9K2A0_BRACR|nr:hypothetical protein F2Q70_00040220 [Brassica cretica]